MSSSEIATEKTQTISMLEDLLELAKEDGFDSFACVYEIKGEPFLIRGSLRNPLQTIGALEHLKVGILKNME